MLTLRAGSCLVLGVAALLAGCGGEKAPVEEARTVPPTPGPVAAMRIVHPDADAQTGQLTVPGGPGQMDRIERPVLVVPGDNGRSYLVTAREETGGCHACAASISVFYLEAASGTTTLAASYREVIQSGAWGVAGEITPLKLRDGLVGMVDASGYTGQGCTETNAAVFRFDARGPVQILEAPLGRSQDAIDIAGNVVKPITADVDFAVNYVGNDNSVPVDRLVTWKLDGDALVPVEGIIPTPVAEGC